MLSRKMTIGILLGFALAIIFFGTPAEAPRTIVADINPDHFANQ